MDQVLAVSSPPAPVSGIWASLAAILVVGYSGMGRTFAYLGLPWIGVYVGEIALAAFLMFRPRTKQGLWLHLVQRVPRLRILRGLILLLLLDGGFEALRGMAHGYPVFAALRDTAFNYYPLFLFLGIWAGLKDPEFLRRVVRSLAWFNASYGLACVLFLSRIAWTLPGFMYATNLSLQSPLGRGEKVGTRISADYLVARAIAPFSRNLAEQLASAKEVMFAAGTTAWRLIWWANIWQEIHSRPSTALLGFGYGYPIGDLNPDIQPGTFIQTPHSVFFYPLAFSGWLGVAVFGLFQIEIVRLLWRSYRITGLAFGVVCWAALLTMSVFEDFFETPIDAIPFFLLLGAAVAPALLARRHAS